MHGTKCKAATSAQMAKTPNFNPWRARFLTLAPGFSPLIGDE
jgi:hypothetical protein